MKATAIVFLLFCAADALAQPAAQTSSATAPPRDGIRPTYVLGPNDQVMIRAANVEDIGDRPYRVEEDGTLNLPLVGRIPAAGRSVQQLEAALIEKLKQYVRDPRVVLSVVQFRSDPVFLNGAFKNPGIYPLQGRRTLVETVASAGGLLPNAGRTVRVVRRVEMGSIPLPSATVDGANGVSSVDIALNQLTEAINPAEDIELLPFDIVSIPRAEMVYVAGEIAKPGSIELGERDSISVAQIVAMSGGLAKTAAAERALVLRPILNSNRRAEIPINVKEILSGKAHDFPLHPNDVLVIPSSGTTRQGLRTASAVVLPPLITTLIFMVAR